MSIQKAFVPEWKSLQHYVCPEWFRDAKFGIWAHWGPQCVPMVGDWYARNMYIQSSGAYQHHCRTYGHPSKFGYKDIVKLWKAERFDPEALIDLYKRGGAKFFAALAVHHDNFDCWNSRHHPWNSVNVGPGRDIVGEWCKAARTAGLKFGVTEHLERSYNWFSTNKESDKYGPYAGVPYDGNLSEYEEFYLPPHDDHTAKYPLNPSQAWMKQWYDRITDLVDQYDPDLLYTDGGVPFGQIGREMVSHFYNRNIERRGGKLDGVYTLKNPARFKGDHGDFVEGTGVESVERGVVEGMYPLPWQIDTCIGGWYYDMRTVYKTPEHIVRLLADVVSKNGTMLLSIPMRPDGTLDEMARWTVEDIGRWFDVCGEAIYGTRPWKQFGEGKALFTSGAFAAKGDTQFTSDDFRFTAKGTDIYAMAMGWTDHAWKIHALAGTAVTGVQMLGVKEPLRWHMKEDELLVEAPAARPCQYAWALKISLK